MTVVLSYLKSKTEESEEREGEVGNPEPGTDRHDAHGDRHDLHAAHAVRIGLWREGARLATSCNN